MRRSLGRLSHPAIGHTSRKAFFLSSFDFSASTRSDGGGSSGGGGSGRGRGRGSDFPKFDFVDSKPEKSEPASPQAESSFPSPLGHGRGKPLSPPSNIPQFASFGASDPNKGTVAGRGRGTVLPPGPPPPQFEENSRPKTPMFFRKDGEVLLPPDAPTQDQPMNQEKHNNPSSILSVLSSPGHGRPTQPTTHVANEKVEEVNRHLKPRQAMQPRPMSPKMSREEAINKARGTLSRDGGAEDAVTGGTQGRFRGVGTRGGGSGGRGQRGGWGGRGRGRGRRGTSYRNDDDDEDDEDEEENEADKVNIEKLAKYLGPEKMDLLVQAFEEASANVLPSLYEDAHVDAMHTNLLLECEPEYLMAEFDSNPDIDEKPPISLRDALEKMKPFLMAYENIESEKEWQAVVEETMKNVPLMKELVDYYSGPNKVTAKIQGEELERVAKTLPASAPLSVKRFTDRAVLSLKSNPGWGFDKKCQFMDKLVWEVSQSYK